MPLKAIVFDLDGTLINSKIDYEKMSASVREVLVSVGVPEKELIERRKVYSIIQGSEDALGAFGLPMMDIPKISSEIVRRMNAVELEAVQLSKPMPNAEETLKRIKERKLRIGIATRGCAAYSVESLRFTGIGKYVDYCLARDEIPFPKPDPRHLLSVISFLGADSASVFYVGDTTTDLDTANAAGVRFIGYNRSPERGKQLLDAGCNESVDNLLDLMKYVDSY